MDLGMDGTPHRSRGVDIGSSHSHESRSFATLGDVDTSLRYAADRRPTMIVSF